MKRPFLITAVALAALLVPSAGLAAGPCNDRDTVLKQLSQQFGEAPIAVGVSKRGTLIEVLKSAPDAEADTWTIIATSPQGLTCLLDAGEGWHDVPRVAQEPET